MKRNIFRGLIPFILVAMLFAGCNSALPTPASTQIPLAQRDLASVVLQKDELPADYSNYTLEKFEGVFPNSPDAHQGVVNSQISLSKSADSRHVYSSGIAVYQNPEQAGKAYKAIRDGTHGDVFTIKPLGDEHYAITTSISSDALLHDIYMAMILWRQGDTVLYVSGVDSNSPLSTQQVEDFANKLQARAAGSSK